MYTHKQHHNTSKKTNQSNTMKKSRYQTTKEAECMQSQVLSGDSYNLLSTSSSLLLIKVKLHNLSL